MRSFDYAISTTIDEALELLAQDADGAARALAGGTDLLTLMKAEVAAPARLVNIKRLAELPRGIEESAEGVTLGALTTLAEIETSPLLRQRFPALAEAAAVAATPQLRNMATIGGNLLILSVRIPPLPAGTRSTYLKAMDRKIWAFALVGVAAVLRLGAGRQIEDARLALGGVAPIPWRVPAAEQELIGAEAGEQLFARAARRRWLRRSRGPTMPRRCRSPKPSSAGRSRPSRATDRV